MLFEYIGRALAPSREFIPAAEDQTAVTTGWLLPFLSLLLISVWTCSLWHSIFVAAGARREKVLHIDAVIIAVSSVAIYSGFPTAACSISLACMIWTRIPGSPLHLSRDLPSLGKFLSSVSKNGASGNPIAENGGEHCLICWEDETSLKMPCNHRLCETCIKSLAKSHKFACPYCQRPLFYDRRELYLRALWNTTLALMFNTAFLHFITVILLANRRRYLAMIGPGCQMVGMMGTSCLWAYIAHQLGAQWWRFFFDNRFIAKFPRLLVAAAYFGHFFTNFVRAAMQVSSENWQMVSV